MKPSVIQSVPTDEDDVNTVLDALRQLEEYGFPLPVPQIIREGGQPPNTLIVESRRDLGDGLNISFRATLSRMAEFQETRTFEVREIERVPNAVEGRTEIAIVRDLSLGVWRWSTRIGKTRSDRINELCNQRGLNLNRIVAVAEGVTDEERAFVMLGMIARWSNQFLFLT